jgi:predicted CoA-substrate-specific enzyme activase
VVITAGVDMGSTATKALVLTDGRIAGSTARVTGADPERSGELALAESLQQAGLELEAMDYIVATGYGRRALELADESVNEINANARGAAWLGSHEGTVRTIIDIGGQDSKAISLDADGVIRDFAMNDKCAAGTGKFLEVIADLLEVSVEDLGDIAMGADKPVSIASTCVVFAQSEVVGLIARKERAPDILAGIHRSIASRVITMARRVGLDEVVVFDGGPAKNKGLRAAIETELGHAVVVPSHPQLVVALGAALVASDLLTGDGGGVPW